MRYTIALLVLFLPANMFGPALQSAPIEGDFAAKMGLPAEGWTATKRFRGGERACVQVAPLEATSVTVEITIHDAAGKKIAEDRGRAGTQDFAAVFWYPPRDGEYKITVTPSNREILFVAIR
jgi:hypothetical protein